MYRPHVLSIVTILYLLCTDYLVLLQGLAIPTPVEVGIVNKASGEPVWSHGESNADASATGGASILETNAWTETNNHGGLQVTEITSNGTEIGYQVLGMTNCSQESYALAMGSLTANALAAGWCNSSVLLDQPVSNEGVINVTTTKAAD